MITLDGVRDVATHPKRGDVIVTACGARMVVAVGVLVRYTTDRGMDLTVTRDGWASMVRSGAVLLTAEHIAASVARLEAP